ncbi:MAG: YcxB family protein [Clostridia bacterium]|nr:YcxB family protein [Clostridia bacterium]
MELKFTDITVSVKLDEKTFKRFARFDMLSLRKKWIRPAVFSLILIAFAVIALLARKEQSGIIAAVLLVVGIGLPLVYIGTFLSQVNMQAARANLKPARPVYTVTMRDESIRIENNQKTEDPQEAAWDSVYKAFRKKDCIYLYVAPTKAFLLPSRQADAPDHDVWEFICDHLGKEKCKG